MVVTCVGQYTGMSVQGRAILGLAESLSLNENEIGPSAQSTKTESAGQISFSINPTSNTYYDGKLQALEVELSANIGETAIGSTRATFSKNSYFIHLSVKPNTILANGDTIANVLLDCNYKK